MRLFLVSIFLLASLAWAQETISCHVTSAVNTDHLHRVPKTAIVVRIPGTWTASGGDFSETAYFYRTAFYLRNASNSVQLHSVDASTVPSAAFGANTITLSTNYPVSLIGSVKLAYNRIPYQAVNLFFNSTQVNSLDLTCAPKQLTTFYGGRFVNGKIIIMASKPVKRCDSNTTSALPASWFTYQTHTCDTGVSACLSFAQGSLCTEGEFLPVDSSRVYWYCTASTNISSDVTYLDYSVLAGRVCDAADNHTVSHTGTTSTSYMRITKAALSATSVHAVSLPVHGDTTHQEVVVDLMYPVNLANFTAAKTYLSLSHSSFSVERCTADRLLTPPSLVVYKCPNEFTPHARVSYTWNLVGSQYVNRFGSVYSEQSAYPHDDELDSGQTGEFAYNTRIIEAYRLSANQLLVRMSHAATELPAADNIKVYLTKLYNVSNITRATASSFYANFDTTNALPDSDDLHVFHFPAAAIGSSAPMLYSEAIAVENGAPDDSEDVGIDDLTGAAKVGVYIALVASGVLGLIILYKASIYCHPQGTKYSRV